MVAASYFLCPRVVWELRRDVWVLCESCESKFFFGASRNSKKKAKKTVKFENVDTKGPDNSGNETVNLNTPT